MNRLAIVFLGLTTSLCALEWSVETTFNLILNPPTTTTGNNVFLTYDSLTGQVLATWGDSYANGSHPPPTYSFYDGISWSYDTSSNLPLTIGTGTGVSSDLYTAFNPTTGAFVATWADSLNSNFPTYSIYTPGSGWSTPATFNSTAASGDQRVYCIYNPVSNSFFASWENTGGEPFYSIYSDGSWSTPTSISTTVVQDADVYLSCNPNTGDVLATWKTSGNIATYSIYNGSTWSAAAILAASPAVQENILSCFDISSGQFMAVWADDSATDYPYYSFYNPISGWTDPAEISSTSQVDTNVAVTQDTSTGAILATWLDSLSANQSPAYSIYDGTSWSATAFISSSATSYSDDFFSCYDSSSGQFFVSWVNSNHYPTYSISSSQSPSEPASFSGVQKTNGFGVVKEYYNVLTWEGNTGVSSYKLYRNNVLIAVLDGSSTSYKDHDQPRKNQLYSLVAVNAYGSSSTALVIVGSK